MIRRTTLQPSHLTFKAGPFCAESLPDRHHHPSSNRNGTKTGHTPSVRPGYGSTPLPQCYRVPTTAKSGPPLQIFVGDPLSMSPPPKRRVENPKMQPCPGRKAAAGQLDTEVVRHHTPCCKSNSSTSISSRQAEPHHPPTQSPRHGTSRCVCSDALHHNSTMHHQSLSATFLSPGLRR